MNLYYYLFYRIYKLASDKAKVTQPELTAVITLTLIEIVNFLSFCRIINSLYGIFLNKVNFAIIGIILFMGNCYIFYKDKKYQSINDLFKGETKKIKIISSILVISLVIFTLVFFVYIVETFKVPSPVGYKRDY